MHASSSPICRSLNKEYDISPQWAWIHVFKEGGIICKVVQSIQSSFHQQQRVTTYLKRSWFSSLTNDHQIHKNGSSSSKEDGSKVVVTSLPARKYSPGWMECQGLPVKSQWHWRSGRQNGFDMEDIFRPFHLSLCLPRYRHLVFIKNYPWMTW